jgi:hypothetical protein
MARHGAIVAHGRSAKAEGIPATGKCNDDDKQVETLQMKICMLDDNNNSNCDKAELFFFLLTRCCPSERLVQSGSEAKRHERYWGLLCQS